MNLQGIQANELAGLVIVESLAVLGLDQVVISPGSRSTPLTYAFANDDRFQVSMVLDERAAGFFALGKAKAAARPVILVCTSGTAAANYLPAIVEARYSGTPLIVLTADRPLMDHYCHAGQTILQTGIYSNFVNHEQQMELPRSSEKYVRYLRESIKNAVRLTRIPRTGVVHLNIPFEDPLTPALGKAVYQQFAQELRKNCFFGKTDELAFTSETLVKSTHIPNDGATAVWIMGPGYRSSKDSLIVRLLHQLERFRIPVLADVLSEARSHQSEISGIVTHYEWLMNAKLGIKDVLKPERVFQFGNLPTSKSLRDALSQWDCEHILIEDGPDDDNRDPAFSRSVGRIQLESIIKGFESSTSTPSPAQLDLYKRWIDGDKVVRSAISTLLNPTGDWVEPVLCAGLPPAIQGNCDLFVANSMIARDMENFFPGASNVRKIYSNRGANGIDGICSTAMGACESGIPLICLIGDLTFIHDASGLNLKQCLTDRQRILFVLLDNHGGGIFEHLPIASVEMNFEQYFATPQNVDIATLSKAYGIDYREECTISAALGSITDFVLNKDVSAGSVRCLHLRFDRKKSYEFRRNILKQLVEIVNP